GQPGCFLATHAAQKDRHQQRRYLVVGQRTRRCCRNKKLNLLAGKRATVTFLHNDVHCAHEAGSISDWPFPTRAWANVSVKRRVTRGLITGNAQKSAASTANVRHKQNHQSRRGFRPKKATYRHGGSERSGTDWHTDGPGTGRRSRCRGSRFLRSSSCVIGSVET